MIDRKLCYTLSAVAWVGVFLCALALLTSARVAAATNTPGTPSAIMAGSAPL